MATRPPEPKLIEEEGALSSEKVFERLTAAQDVASKEANRLFLASLALVVFYAIKASGLRVDITMLDTSLSDIPHGLFFFLVASQISMILCYMRTGDAIAIRSRIRFFARETWPTKEEDALKTFVNSYEWFSASQETFDSHTGGHLARAIYVITSVVTSPIVLVLYSLPIATGVFCLIDWQAQIATGDVELQYWVLLSTTVASGLWLLNFFAIYSTLHEE